MAVETLTDLRERLKTHQDEPVLVVVRVLRDIGSCHGPKIGMELEESLLLGICTPPFLNRVENRMLDFTIPTPCQTVSTDRYCRERIKVEDGPIGHWRMLSGHFGRTLRQIDPDPGGIFSSEYQNHKDKPILEVGVGDEEVTAWFINHAYFGRMPVYERMQLSRLEKTGEKIDLQRSIRERHFDAALLYGYQKMRKALGLLPAILPADIQGLVDSRIEIRKLQILDSLEELNNYGHRLEFGNMLHTAIDFSMDTEEREITRHPRPGFTLVINVPEFIKGAREMIGA